MAESCFYKSVTQGRDPNKIMEGICRTCLTKSSSLSTIFQDDLLSKIKAISSIEVRKDDTFSDKICCDCVRQLNMCYTFRNLIIKCDSLMKTAAFEGDSPSSSSDRTICKPNLDLIDNIIKVDIDDHISDDIANNIKTDIDDYICNDISNNVKADDFCTIKIEEEDPSEFFMKDYILKSRATKYLCRKCPFQGSDKKDLAKHTSANHKHMVKCEICNVTVSITNIKKHMIIHSTKDESVTCPICNRVFKNLPSYRNHPKDHIPEESTCEICGKQFHFLGERIRHLYKHNGKNPRVACEVCGKVFRKTLLAQHLLVHTGEKPHVCSFCGKKFSTRWAMRSHERQHTNETPYKCELCPMAFRHGVSLKAHVRSKH